MRKISQRHSPRESAEDYTLRQRRGESSQVHGDQTGRDGGTKKIKEENGPLDDLDQNEDGRGFCHQPLSKTDPEAADRSPSRIVKVLRDLMRGGQQELRTGIASHFSPGLAALPHFQTMFFFG